MEKPKILEQSEIDDELKNLSGWSYKDDKISKEYKFEDFMDAFNFISGLTSFFEKMDHHPDMHIFYNKILFELQRFDIGGKVTDRDFTVAREIEEQYASR